MPRLSERQEVLQAVEELLEVEILCEDSGDSDLFSDESDFFKGDDLEEMDGEFNDDDLMSSDTDDEDYELDGDLLELYMCLQHSRYLGERGGFAKSHLGERGILAKSHDSVNNVFYNLPPRSFRQLTRMQHSSFFELVRLIEDHPVFFTPTGNFQNSVAVQLAVALDRFGHNGNGACLTPTLFSWGISHGSMVNFTNRCMVALEERLADQVGWPDQAERMRISSEFSEQGFPGCVGLIGGTLLPFSQRPKFSSETYYDRKSNYSVNAQVVCDDTGKITYLFAGMPGSCEDFTCLKRSALWPRLNVPGTFEEDQYLLGDSRYLPLPHLVPAFPMTSQDKDKEDFNSCLAHALMVNKHCVGVLKSRWHSLYELRNQLKNSSHNKHLVRWICCCALLHNYALGRNDVWTEEDQAIILGTEEPEATHSLTSQKMEEEGLQRQEEVLKKCLDFNRQPGGFLSRSNDV